MTADDFSAHLLPGETPLWTGTPAQGLRLAARDWFLVPFSLLWLAFAVFWETRAWGQANAPAFFKLWGAGFVVIGLFFAGGRFALDSLLRRRTYYALTPRRILIARGGLFGKFTAISLDRLPEASVSMSRDGRGTIRFGEQPPVLGRRAGFSTWVPSLDATPQFIGIEDAQSVFNQVQQAAAQLRGP